MIFGNLQPETIRTVTPGVAWGAKHGQLSDWLTDWLADSDDYRSQLFQKAAPESNDVSSPNWWTAEDRSQEEDQRRLQQLNRETFARKTGVFLVIWSISTSAHFSKSEWSTSTAYECDSQWTERVVITTKQTRWQRRRARGLRARRDVVRLAKRPKKFQRDLIVSLYEAANIYI